MYLIMRADGLFLEEPGPGQRAETWTDNTWLAMAFSSRAEAQRNCRDGDRVVDTKTLIRKPGEKNG